VQTVQMASKTSKMIKKKKSIDLAGKRLDGEQVLAELKLRPCPETISEVKINNNLVSSLNFDALAALLPNLSTLNVSKNNIRKLSPNIAKLTSLTKLNLKDVGISKLPSQIGGLTNLTDLQLQHNMLAFLPNQLTDLVNLSKLNVSNNKLRSLLPSLFKMTKLSKLNIENNPLMCPPTFICAKGLTQTLRYLQHVYEDLNDKDLPRFPKLRLRTTQDATDTEGSRSFLTDVRDAFFVVSHCVTTTQGNRPYMEDRYKIEPAINIVDYLSKRQLQRIERRKQRAQRRISREGAKPDVPGEETRESISKAHLRQRSKSETKNISPSKSGSRRFSNPPQVDEPSSHSNGVRSPSPSKKALGRLVKRKKGKKASALPDIQTIEEEPSEHSTEGDANLDYNFMTSMGKIAFFGLYDGHGGDRAADYCTDLLHVNIFKQYRCFMEHNIPAAMKQGFIDTDKGFLSLAKGGDQKWRDGSTGLVLLLQNNKLFTAHVGDSRAVLCREKRAIELTDDHKPDREDEQQRIESIGGSVVSNSSTGWIARVNGHLAVSRAFGDIRLKTPSEFVTAVPELGEFILDHNDQFIIMASDGLWDVMINQEAVDIVRKCKDKKDASEELVNRALKLGSSDNITVIVIWLRWTIDFPSTPKAPGSHVSPKVEVDSVASHSSSSPKRSSETEGSQNKSSNGKFVTIGKRDKRGSKPRPGKSPRSRRHSEAKDRKEKSDTSKEKRHKSAQRQQKSSKKRESSKRQLKQQQQQSVVAKSNTSIETVVDSVISDPGDSGYEAAEDTLSNS